MRCGKSPVLSLIAKRQYLDWREFRYLDVNSAEVRREVGRFCTHIRDALRHSRLSPEERRHQEEVVARQKAEAERQRQEAEAKHRAEGQEQQRAAEEERRKREAELERGRIASLEANAREDELRRQREAMSKQQKADAEQRVAQERRQLEAGEAAHEVNIRKGDKKSLLQYWMVTVSSGFLAFMSAIFGYVGMTGSQVQPVWPLIALILFIFFATLFVAAMRRIVLQVRNKD
jgi:hypothetical protein